MLYVPGARDGKSSFGVMLGCTQTTWKHYAYNDAGNVCREAKKKRYPSMSSKDGRQPILRVPLRETFPALDTFIIIAALHRLSQDVMSVWKCGICHRIRGI